MAFPTIRTKIILLLLRVLFVLYLALALVTVVFSYYEPEKWRGMISFIPKIFLGLPGSVLVLDAGNSHGVSDETLGVLLFIPIALNLLVLWALAFVTNKHVLWARAFVTNKHHLHPTLLVFETVALLGLLDARNALACTRDSTSVLPTAFWQKLLGWMTTGGDEELLECPNISWAFPVAAAFIVVVHGYYTLVQSRTTTLGGKDAV